MGAYPAKALAVLRDVATRMEAWGREEKFGSAVLPQLGQAADERVSEEVRALDPSTLNPNATPPNLKP